MRIQAARCALAFLLLAAVVRCVADEASLLANGAFAADLSGWQKAGAATWTSYDRYGAANSGSAYVSNTSAGANTRVPVLRQCIPVTQRGVFLFGASSYVPATAVQGNLVASTIAHLSNDCSGGGNASGIFLPSVDAWQDYSSSINVMYVPGSIELTLSVDKTDAGATFAGYFDAVYLIDDTLFSGDFE
jgi:hypothetical protein